MTRSEKVFKSGSSRVVSSSSSKSLEMVRSRRAAQPAIEQQIEKAIQEEDWDSLADYLSRFGERLLVSHGSEMVAKFFKALPSRYLSASAELSAALAWVLVYQGEPLLAKKHYLVAERSLKKGEVISISKKSALLEIESGSDLRASLEALKHQLAAQLDGVLPENVDAMLLPASSEHPLWRADALLVTGLSRLHRGALVEACSDFEMVLFLADTGRGPRAEAAKAQALSALALIATEQLDFSKAEAHLQALADLPSATPASSAHFEVQLGKLRLDYYRQSLAQFESHWQALGTALDEASSTGKGTIDKGLGEPDLGNASDPSDKGKRDETLLSPFYLLGAVYFAETGDEERAMGLLNELERKKVGQDLAWQVRHIQLLRASIALDGQKIALVNRWVQSREMADRRLENLTHPIEVLERILLSRYYRSQSTLEKAEEELLKAKAFLESHPYPQLEVLLGLEEALYLDEKGKSEDAKALYKGFLALCEEKQYPLPFKNAEIQAYGAKLALTSPLLGSAPHLRLIEDEKPES